MMRLNEISAELSKKLQDVTDQQTVLYAKSVRENKEDIRKKLLKIGSRINLVWRKKKYKNESAAIEALNKASEDLGGLEKLFNVK